MEAEVTTQKYIFFDFQGDLSSMALSGVTLACELAMIFGGVVPFVPQYLDIRRKETTKGFSIYVCLALLVANTLRILFWFGRFYETPLLIQSILMNIAMLALIHLCVKINSQNQILRRKERLFQDEENEKLEVFEHHIFIDFDSVYFWQWSDFQSYVECILSFAACGSLLMFIFIDNVYFVETVGFFALFTEAMLGVPQFYRNYCNKSTYGMSLPMVLMWTCGDIFKTTYFILRKTPPQFFICGSLQITVDLAILMQVWLYYEKSSKQIKSEEIN
ncbi:solute carrier family 66 member 2 isoform X1 [Lepeophtheirus salmonis]|uniref:Solute carrier family 66 member 2 n=1 Tax=Lepeophtheirus salmonis TaxID=72036 RepID=A0A0K2UHU9_LEPSM|nr:solute carrier family 66 member 2-like isoform X1 [Lepeophtheirus salmonis]